MAVYGIKVKDASGNTVKITPDIANVISSSQVTMPNSLVDTDKYYASVDLPGTAAIPIDNIGIIMNAFLLNVSISAVVAAIGTSYGTTFFAKVATTQYTKNLSTGVMTAWTPGSMADSTVDAQWDSISSIYPEIYWDKFSDSTVTAVKIFAAMRYHCYDASASAYINSYMLGSNGVEKVDYVITMRRKETE